MVDVNPQETAEQFRERLADGDRWMELVEGRLVRLNPPDEIHGNVVRNVSKRLASCLRKSPTLFPCFELGLIVARRPDTVRCPAISCFTVKGGMAEADELITDRRPELIVEVASSNDRRSAMSERIQAYQFWGVPAIWVFDPQSLHAHVFQGAERPRMLKGTETLRDWSVIPSFQIVVGEAFADPAWSQETRAPQPDDEST